MLFLYLYCCNAVQVRYLYRMIENFAVACKKIVMKKQVKIPFDFLQQGMS
jgi:hypothetical protein